MSAVGEGPYAGSIGFAAGSDTSEEAAETLDASTLRARVLEVVKSTGAAGVTRGELASLFGSRVQPATLSARLRELTIEGHVCDSGERRECAATGRRHTAWIAMDDAPPVREPCDVPDVTGPAPLIYTGDCVAWLRTLADKSVDVCIMDPPYSEHVHSKSMRSGDSRSRQQRERGEPRREKLASRELGFAHLAPKLQRDVAREVARVTRRWVLTFCTAEMQHDWQAALERFHLQHVRVGAWIKPNAAPQFTGDRPSAGWEAIEVAHPRGKKRWNGGGHSAVWTHSIQTGSYRGDRVHSTEKPISLMLELVKLFTEPGELVIDPFAGSGSTGVACVRTGRRFAGAEMDATMAEHARERLEAERCNLSLSAARMRQTPLFPGAHA